MRTRYIISIVFIALFVYMCRDIPAEPIVKPQENNMGTYDWANDRWLTDSQLDTMVNVSGKWYGKNDNNIPDRRPYPRNKPESGTTKWLKPTYRVSKMKSVDKEDLEFWRNSQANPGNCNCPDENDIIDLIQQNKN
jgi:hypothetical protein